MDAAAGLRDDGAMRAISIGLVLVAACGGGGGSGDDPDQPDAGPLVDAGPISSCDPPGHFGVPEFTFTLPAQGTGFPYADVQAAFPEVDWQTLDRLYLPAGEYTNIQLGNLPTRTAERPLVITNLGGQFKVGGNPGGNYIWSFGGGANWILTGRYDAESQTGDVDFPGHACGNYPDSEGRYGIFSDDGFALDAPYLHMGLAVGGATDFEIEYVEVARSGFAGIRLLNHPDDGTDKPMANVKVHDTYVHDTDGEGYYFGWTGGAPSNLMPGLQVYNNRVLRTGNEALQIQDVGHGSRIYGNAFLSGGLHWLDNGLGSYQDNLSQVSVREGEVELTDNLFIDGAGSLMTLWSQPQAGDGERQIRLADNYFANSLSLGVYLGGSAGPGSSITFAGNTFRDHVFGFAPASPGATDPGVLISRGGDVNAAISITANRWDGVKDLTYGIDGGDGTSGPITASGNTPDAPAAPTFEDAGPFWSEAGRHVEWWTATATVVDGSPAVTYAPGAIVAHGDAPTFYRCTSSSSGTAPPDAPGSWEVVPRGADDVRTVAGSPYAALGVR